MSILVSEMHAYPSPILDIRSGKVGDIYDTVDMYIQFCFISFSNLNYDHSQIVEQGI